MDIPKLSERLMGMNEATWDRHANPWSGWTRITILPLLSVAVMSRVWLGWWAVIPVFAVVIWTWLNPRLFRPPAHDGAWMTKGVLGERVWLARGETPIPAHHARVARLLSIAAGLGVLILAYGLWQLSVAWTFAGLSVTMGAKLWFLDRMVWLLADMQTDKD
jgi:hypothetical protein